MMPTVPRYSRPCSSAASVPHRPGSARRRPAADRPRPACAARRRPSPPRRPGPAPARRHRAPPWPCPRRAWVQRASSTSGAPLVRARCASPSAWSATSTDIILRCDVKGISPRRVEALLPSGRLGCAVPLAELVLGHQERGFGGVALDPQSPPVVLRSWALPARLPPLQHGLQLRVQRADGCKSAPACSARPRGIAHAGDVAAPEAVITRCTVISPRVSVPVLSDAMTEADPSVSTEASFLTMAWWRAMRARPSPAPPTGWPAGLRARRPRPATPPAAAP
jgi:hypothetical protein